jgi:hypothetical protein
MPHFFLKLARNNSFPHLFVVQKLNIQTIQEALMDWGKGLILWLIGIPIPVILLIAMFWHH